MATKFMILGEVSWEVQDPKFAEVARDWHRRLNDALPDELPEEAVFLPVLPTEEDERFVILQLDAVEEGTGRCSLYLSDPPPKVPDEDDDPKSVWSAASTVGGYIPVRQLAERFKAKGAVTYSIHYHVDANEHTCSVLPQAPVLKSDCDSGILALGAGAVRKRARFELSGGACGITGVDIGYSSEGDQIFVTAKAKGLLRFGEGRWLPLLDEIHDTIQSTLFNR